MNNGCTPRSKSILILGPLYTTPGCVLARVESPRRVTLLQSMFISVYMKTVVKRVSCYSSALKKTEHFRALTSNSHSSAIADHMTQKGHRIKWDHCDILATGQSEIHYKIKETLLICDLKPALNENVGSEKLLLY